MDALQQLSLETINKGKQALVFLPSRSSAEKAAEDIAKLTALQLPQLEKDILHAVSTPTKQCRRLSHCLRKGVAFHHAGLTQKQKDLIEDGFREGSIKIVCATPTLAAGLSLPAYRVIIKSLKRYTGSWGMDWIPVLEYLQMAGRAGRPEYEKEGQSIVIAKDENEQQEIYEKYICGVPEEIYSKLAVEPVLRTYLLSLISAGIIRNEKSMMDFFGKTFWAQQFGDMPKLETIMMRMLQLLEKWGFIVIGSKEKSDFVSANTLHNTLDSARVLQPTLIGKRVSELYLDPLTARHFLECLPQVDEKKNEFSLLQMVSHTLELRPLLRVRVKQQETIQEHLVKNYDQLLTPEPSAFDLEYDEFLNSIKTALFFESWIDECDEEYLFEQFDIRPGEIKVKLDTADWLLYSCEELAKIKNYRHATKMIAKLRLRLKDGVKEELLVLLKLKGIGRIRARRLFSQGIKDIGDVKTTDITALGQILGKAIAEDIKKQVGEEIVEVKKGTRKGQLSVLKFG